MDYEQFCKLHKLSLIRGIAMFLYGSPRTLHELLGICSNIDKYMRTSLYLGLSSRVGLSLVKATCVALGKVPSELPIPCTEMSSELVYASLPTTHPEMSNTDAFGLLPLWSGEYGKNRKRFLQSVMGSALKIEYALHPDCVWATVPGCGSIGAVVGTSSFKYTSDDTAFIRHLRSFPKNLQRLAELAVVYSEAMLSLEFPVSDFEAELQAAVGRLRLDKPSNVLQYLRNAGCQIDNGPSTAEKVGSVADFIGAKFHRMFYKPVNY